MPAVVEETRRQPGAEINPAAAEINPAANPTQVTPDRDQNRDPSTRIEAFNPAQGSLRPEEWLARAAKDVSPEFMAATGGSVAVTSGSAGAVITTTAGHDVNAIREGVATQLKAALEAHGATGVAEEVLRVVRNSQVPGAEAGSNSKTDVLRPGSAAQPDGAIDEAMIAKQLKALLGDSEETERVNEPEVRAPRILSTAADDGMVDLEQDGPAAAAAFGRKDYRSPLEPATPAIKVALEEEVALAETPAVERNDGIEAPVAPVDIAPATEPEAATETAAPFKVLKGEGPGSFRTGRANVRVLSVAA